ncbi:hypothetical protein TRIATDRAFT_283096 [Trichoderma atroviride IMI 206040]|uniref:Nephrocystin 3-like N-terminal domain-containing protein n=1 Tax=Hypocrea atroviridis (strain ATCC 20476 / IMI 206040) TaxID=452589 RepID=G9NRK1_HYPAI|nr:uncharacterized protein TRIATDRAFT_283096 [Trichoderma atroviride IMI 206040]EHK46634.1 hypothetical protein TRIATDRAFT_283096 [Trichoderma atroviride IMI 206040]
MGPERLTAVTNNEKAVNVGSSQRIQHQDASVGSNAKSVHTGYESRDITVINNKITHHYAPPSELPYRGNLAAGYVKNYLVSPDDDINWSKRSQDFLTRNEAENESSEIFQDELDKAIDSYSGISWRRQSPRIDHLKAIKTNMISFSSWLKALNTDQHRSSLCENNQVLRDQDELDAYAVEKLANVFCLFGDGTEYYLRAIENEKLTSSIIEDTIVIYECLVIILVLLLHGIRMLEQYLRNEYIQKRQMNLSNSSMAQTDKSCLKSTNVIRYLNYRATGDFKRCITVGRPNFEHIQQLARLTHGEIYRTWLTDEYNSSALLVEGGSAPTESITSLSYLCARIVQEYKDTDRIFVLSYFGGIRGEQANATDVLCQMLGQLLTYKLVANIYLRHPIEQELKDKIKRKDFATLLDVFLKLIKQLEPYKGVIFCIIDSVSMIERGKQKKNAENLLLALNKVYK